MEQSIFKLSIEYGAHSMRILENVKKMMALHWGGGKKPCSSMTLTVKWHSSCVPHTLSGQQEDNVLSSSSAGRCTQIPLWKELGHCCPACSRSRPGDVERRNSKGEILFCPISPKMGNSTGTNEISAGNRRFLCDQLCPKFCSKRQNLQPVELAHKLAYNYLRLIVTTLRFPTCKFSLIF